MSQDGLTQKVVIHFSKFTSDGTELVITIFIIPDLIGFMSYRQLQVY
jgi:hypothetical protein